MTVFSSAPNHKVSTRWEELLEGKNGFTDQQTSKPYHPTTIKFPGSGSGRSFSTLKQKARKDLLSDEDRRYLYLNMLCGTPPKTMEFNRYVSKYAMVVEQIVDSCPGCGLLDASHMPTFGANYLPQYLDHHMSEHVVSQAVDIDFNACWSKHLFQKHCLSSEGRKAAKRVLLALDHDHHIDFFPILPDLVCLLLVTFSEVETYIIATKIIERSRRNRMWSSDMIFRSEENESAPLKHLCYFPTNNQGMYVFVRTFLDTLKERMPLVYRHLVGIHDEFHCELEDVVYSWFTRLFVPLVSLPIVHSILDCIVVEGAKIFFRFGLAILKVMFKPVVFRLPRPPIMHATEAINKAAFLATTRNDSMIVRDVNSIYYPICEVSDVLEPPPPSSPSSSLENFSLGSLTIGNPNNPTSSAVLGAGTPKPSRWGMNRRDSGIDPSTSGGGRASISSSFRGTSLLGGGMASSSSRSGTLLNQLRMDQQTIGGDGGLGSAASQAPVGTGQPLSSVSDQPLSSVSDQPLSSVSDQPFSSMSGQPLSPVTSQPPVVTSQITIKPPSTTTTQPPLVSKRSESSDAMFARHKLENQPPATNPSRLHLQTRSNTTQPRERSSSNQSLVVMARRTVSASALFNRRKSKKKGWSMFRKGQKGRANQRADSDVDSVFAGTPVLHSHSASDILTGADEEEEQVRSLRASGFGFRAISTVAFGYRNMGRDSLARKAETHRQAASEEYRLITSSSVPAPHFPKQAIEKSSTIFSYADATRLVGWLPAKSRAKAMGLRLQYSTEVHGRSLDALYRECAAPDVGPCIIVIRAMDPLHWKRPSGASAVKESDDTMVFGGYCSEPLQPQSHHHYIGDGTCFLFRLSPTEDAQVWRFNTTPTPSAAWATAQTPHRRRPRGSSSFGESCSSQVNGITPIRSRDGSFSSVKNADMQVLSDTTETPGSPHTVTPDVSYYEGSGAMGSPRLSASEDLDALNGHVKNWRGKARAIDQSRLKFVYPRRDQLVFGSAETVKLDGNGCVIPKGIYDDTDSESEDDSDLSDVSDALDDETDEVHRKLTHKHFIGPGLWMCKDLLRGHSGWCNTYRNDPLCLHCTETPQVEQQAAGDETEKETKLHMKHFYFEIAALEVFTIPKL